jgi:hypothetical protein
MSYGVKRCVCGKSAYLSGVPVRSRPLVALGLAALLVPAFAVACKKTTAMTALGCEVVHSAAAAAVVVAEHEANAAAKCDADSDCVESPTARCLVGCSGHAVPKAAASSFAARVGKVDGDECRRWTDGNCDVITPRSMPSCPRYVPRCQDHRCAMADARTP